MIPLNLRYAVEQHLPVVHISVAFVVYGHHIQEHDVGGCGFESAESHLDSGEHPPIGENKKTTRTTHSLR